MARLACSISTSTWGRFPNSPRNASRAHANGTEPAERHHGHVGSGCAGQGGSTWLWGSSRREHGAALDESTGQQGVQRRGVRGENRCFSQGANVKIIPSLHPVSRW